jgi:hypothetical protein
MALFSGVAGVNNRRSELNKEDVTGILSRRQEAGGRRQEERKC